MEEGGVVAGEVEHERRDLLRLGQSPDGMRCGERLVGLLGRAEGREVVRGLYAGGGDGVDADARSGLLQRDGALLMMTPRPRCFMTGSCLSE